MMACISEGALGKFAVHKPISLKKFVQPLKMHYTLITKFRWEHLVSLDVSQTLQL